MYVQLQVGLIFIIFHTSFNPFPPSWGLRKLARGKKGKTYHQRALLTHTANDGNDDGWLLACEDQGKETGNLHASSWL